MPLAPHGTLGGVTCAHRHFRYGVDSPGIPQVTLNDGMDRPWEGLCRFYTVTQVFQVWHRFHKGEGV